MARNNMMTGGNKVVNNPRASSNAELGIAPEVAAGSYGSRENMGSIAGSSGPTPSRSVTSPGGNDAERNAGGGTRPSASAGNYFGDSGRGSVASRENMTLGGGENRGREVGEGVGSTKASRPDSVVPKGIKSGAPVVSGSGNDRAQEARSQKGIGRGRSGR